MNTELKNWNPFKFLRRITHEVRPRHPTTRSVSNAGRWNGLIYLAVS